MTPASIKAAERRYWVAFVACCVPFFILLILVELEFHVVIDWLSSLGIGFDQENVSAIVIGSGIVVPLFVILWARKRFLLRCPQCSHILGPESIKAALITKKCPGCGHVIIADRAKGAAGTATGGQKPPAPRQP